MIIEKLNNPNFPKDAYVDVLEPIDADVSILYPYSTDNIDYNDCVCIFWVRGINNNRRYFLAEYFEKFDNSELEKVNEGHYKTEGVLVFTKKINFLEKFKQTNPNYLP